MFCFLIPGIFWLLSAYNNTGDSLLVDKVLKTSNLIALWTFEEDSGIPRLSLTNQSLALLEGDKPIPKIDDGPLSGSSILLDGSSYLSIPNKKTGSLNISGPGRHVTLIAWVKWSGEQTGFVGGMWNEYQDGGKRQYGLFVSLPYYNGKDQVCGHVSYSGKATPPFPYSMDYSASEQVVAPNEWVCIAFTYDGTWIKSFVNGEFINREEELINHTIGYPGFPDGITQSKNPYFFPDGIGDNGSDFTVGAVLLKSGMGNFFKGQIGGLAVFDRALDEEELKNLVD
ncbi:LamG-like jellyroll fold domain-containing protein [Algoriphagus zhangzhouensis]|uniref:Concanavalin A-like lectin/glucanases superfamily protein n=1 Tax=Algoriphagus zhangzhouensis TaxID=1073327 RepID=A0A1M7Z5M2_9BACT|nr:LamG-like jellyroll fold domain-containing protein [Algoriphagus zhangzhouensis]TDY48979.1 concanavalin A-like lectin/glucanase superfamily protein [Algoriphagus zhangzhouensis]SHO60247.1 Concanavalin A-like lectin/glucanases superfamily protein [Algoriphagus zhangzhouensis]